jgi:AraC-like DNA-binding protein
MRLLVLASRDRRNPGFAGGDLTMSEVAEHLAASGHEVTYVCSRFFGTSYSDVIRNVRVVDCCASRALILFPKPWQI